MSDTRRIDGLLDEIEDLLGAGLAHKAEKKIAEARRYEKKMSVKQQRRFAGLSLDYTAETTLFGKGMKRSLGGAGAGSSGGGAEIFAAVINPRTQVAVAPRKGVKQHGCRRIDGILVPKKNKGETWLAYHDRMAKMGSDAQAVGKLREAAVYLSVAGEIARVRRSVRDKPRSRAKKAKGPGTYPWDECIRNATARYAHLPDVAQRARRVCGAIRARSQRKYPVYWAARDPGRALPKPNPCVPLDKKGDLKVTKSSLPTVASVHKWIEHMREYELAAEFAGLEQAKLRKKLEKEIRWAQRQRKRLEAALKRRKGK